MLTSTPPTTIPGAPSYKSFFETSARTLDLGSTYSARADVVPITKPTFISLDTTLSIPWHVYSEDAMGNVTQPLKELAIHDALAQMFTGVVTP